MCVLEHRVSFLLNIKIEYTFPLGAVNYGSLIYVRRRSQLLVLLKHLTLALFTSSFIVLLVTTVQTIESRVELSVKYI